MLDSLVIVFDREAEVAGIAAKRHVLVALGNEIEVAGGAGRGGLFCVGGGGGYASYACP